jgi:hypothetical protein
VLGDLDLAAWRPLRLLLEPVEQDDAASSEESVDHSVDVGPTFLTKLPQLAVELPDEGLTGSDVSNPELLDRPVKTRLCH